MEKDRQTQDGPARKIEIRGALATGCSMWSPIIPPVCDAKDVEKQDAVALDKKPGGLNLFSAASTKTLKND